MANVLNYNSQALPNGDNVLNLTGTVVFSGDVSSSGTITSTGTLTTTGTTNLGGTVNNTGTTNLGGTVVLTGTFNGLLAAHVDNTLASTVVTEYSTNSAIDISGIALITGGTGLSGMTLAAPSPGALCRVILTSLASGSVVVKTPSGVTFDGTNNTATYNATGEMLLGYKTAVEWIVAENTVVVFSST